MVKEEDYRSVKEYAEEKKISVQAVYQKIRKSQVRHKKIGSIHLVADLET